MVHAEHEPEAHVDGQQIGEGLVLEHAGQGLEGLANGLVGIGFEGILVEEKQGHHVDADQTGRGDEDDPGGLLQVHQIDPADDGESKRDQEGAQVYHPVEDGIGVAALLDRGDMGDGGRDDRFEGPGADTQYQYRYEDEHEWFPSP